MLNKHVLLFFGKMVHLPYVTQNRAQAPTLLGSNTQFLPCYPCDFGKLEGSLVVLVSPSLQR